jgi:hypothetical protein
MHDIPGIWIGNKLNKEIAAGWNTAAYEIETGNYVKFTVHPVFGIHKAW